MKKLLFATLLVILTIASSQASDTRQVTSPALTALSAEIAVIEKQIDEIDQKGEENLADEDFDKLDVLYPKLSKLKDDELKETLKLMDEEREELLKAKREETEELLKAKHEETEELLKKADERIEKSLRDAAAIERMKSQLDKIEGLLGRP